MLLVVCMIVVIIAHSITRKCRKQMFLGTNTRPYYYVSNDAMSGHSFMPSYVLSKGSVTTSITTWARNFPSSDTRYSSHRLIKSWLQQLAFCRVWIITDSEWETAESSKTKGNGSCIGFEVQLVCTVCHHSHWQCRNLDYLGRVGGTVIAMQQIPLGPISVQGPPKNMGLFLGKLIKA